MKITSAHTGKRESRSRKKHHQINESSLVRRQLCVSHMCVPHVKKRRKKENKDAAVTGKWQEGSCPT